MRKWTRTSGAAILVIAIILAVGCSAPQGGSRGAAAPSQGSISIEGAFARSSPSVGGAGGVFFTVRNTGSTADRLAAGAFTGSEAVELHETIMEDGVMKMRPHMEGWEVPANGTLELKPGGKHVMLINLKEPLVAGKDIEVTLTFEKAGNLTVKVPVKEP